MLSQQSSGLPRRWYFPNPVGNVARVVEDLKERMILVVSVEQFLPSQPPLTGVHDAWGSLLTEGGFADAGGASGACQRVGLVSRRPR